MKNRTHRDSARGSALLAALIVIVILTFAAAGVLSYSLTTYRNSVRQAMLDQGKVIADSEMENLYYNWKNQLLLKKPVDNIVALLGPTSGSPAGNGLTDPANTYPFDQTMVTTNGWSVTRSLTYNPIPTASGAATGMVAGTNQVGNIYYFTAKTSATINLPLSKDVTEASRGQKQLVILDDSGDDNDSYGRLCAKHSRREGRPKQCWRKKCSGETGRYLG